jgi:hypothetical protein
MCYSLFLICAFAILAAQLVPLMCDGVGFGFSKIWSYRYSITGVLAGFTMLYALGHILLSHP